MFYTADGPLVSRTVYAAGTSRRVVVCMSAATARAAGRPLSELVALVLYADNARLGVGFLACR